MLQLSKTGSLCKQIQKNFKKLVSILTIFMLGAKSNKKDIILERVLSIYYPLHFLKTIINIRTLLDSSGEGNAMTLAYAASLDLTMWSTNIEVQMINNFTFETFKMVLANF